jgi:hypothetical protein
MSEEDVVILIDPTGTRISVGKHFICDTDAPADDLYNGIIDVIERPALIIESSALLRRFYFRSVGWNHTMLITTNYTNDVWLVTRCQFDPDNAVLSTLYMQGKQVYG